MDLKGHNKQTQKSRIRFSYIIGILFLISAVFIFIRFFLLLKAPTNECEAEKKLSFAGIVIGIQLDSFNKAQKFIILSNNVKIIPPYTYGLWNEVQVGDSLVKHPNSLNYSVYLSPDYKKVKELLWDKPCP